MMIGSRGMNENLWKILGEYRASQRRGYVTGLVTMRDFSQFVESIVLASSNGFTGRPKLVLFSSYGFLSSSKARFCPIIVTVV